MVTKNTKALTAANARTDEISMFGGYNLIISGTWAGEVKLLRRFENMRSLGTHTTGADADTITHAVTDPAFVTATNALIGMWISNDTDGSFGPITANDGTTITATLAGGAREGVGAGKWAVGDVFSLWYVATTRTTNCDVQADEPELGTTILAVLSTLSSGGPVLVRISQ